MNDLADVVSGARLHFFAEVALLIFLTVFVAILARVILTKRSHFDREANLPLEDDAAPSNTSSPRGT
jgi:cbb3-type cytochrome oxidase subunit 3